MPIDNFGFDRSADKFIGFAYRSTDDFVSEPLEYGDRLKPDPEGAIASIQQFPADFITSAETQKSLDESKPISERVGAGGHLIACMMQKEDDGAGGTNTVTRMWRCHEFEDYEAMYDRAVAKLNQSSGRS